MYTEQWYSEPFPSRINLLYWERLFSYPKWSERLFHSEAAVNYSFTISCYLLIYLSYRKDWHSLDRFMPTPQSTVAWKHIKVTSNICFANTELVRWCNIINEKKQKQANAVMLRLLKKRVFTFWFNTRENALILLI